MTPCARPTLARTAPSAHKIAVVLVCAYGKHALPALPWASALRTLRLRRAAERTCAARQAVATAAGWQRRARGRRRRPRAAPCAPATTSAAAPCAPALAAPRPNHEPWTAVLLAVRLFGRQLAPVRV